MAVVGVITLAVAWCFFGALAAIQVRWRLRRSFRELRRRMLTQREYFAAIRALERAHG